MSRKRERLNEMIAYENKLLEAYALEHQLHRELNSRGMCDRPYRLVLDCVSGITEPAPRARATIDTYIDQMRRRLETVRSVQVSES
jgi:hypothetical protein